MKNEKENLEQLFSQFKDGWDTEEPTFGHKQRFMQRLEHKSERKSIWLKIAVPVAAAIAVLLGIYIGYQPEEEPKTAELSPEVQETQLYFTSIIKNEMAKVESESTPETKKIVDDALKRMEMLEQDYEKLTHELAEKGENKKIIHAMITNLQIRISFLEEVLIQIENTKKIKDKYHESNQV